MLSGSMEPGFYRGDILFLYQPQRPVDTGDISAWGGGCSLGLLRGLLPGPAGLLGPAGAAAGLLGWRCC